MKSFTKLLMIMAVFGMTSGALTACKKKIYLERPEVKEGQEVPNDPEAGTTEKRVPYVVDEEVYEQEPSSSRD